MGQFKDFLSKIEEANMVGKMQFARSVPAKKTTNVAPEKEAPIMDLHVNYESEAWKTIQDALAHGTYVDTTDMPRDKLLAIFGKK